MLHECINQECVQFAILECIDAKHTIGEIALLMSTQNG